MAPVGSRCGERRSIGRGAVGVRQQRRAGRARHPRWSPDVRPGRGGDNARHPDLGAVEAPCSPRAVAAISSRWLTACSMPEAGAVEPATPMAMPLRVRIRASSARLSRADAAGERTGQRAHSGAGGRIRAASHAGYGGPPARSDRGQVPVGAGGEHGQHVADPGPVEVRRARPPARRCRRSGRPATATAWSA